MRINLAGLAIAVFLAGAGCDSTTDDEPIALTETTTGPAAIAAPTASSNPSDVQWTCRGGTPLATEATDQPAVVLTFTSNSASTGDIEQFAETAPCRLDAMGIRGVSATASADGRLGLRTDDVAHTDRIQTAINATARLEFRPVLAFFSTEAPAELGTVAAMASSLPGLEHLQPIADRASRGDPVTLADVISPPDSPRPDEAAVIKDAKGQLVYVLHPSGADESIVASAEATFAGSWFVDTTFTQDGAEIFDQLAAKTIGQQLAIVVDGTVVSAPTVQTADFGGTAQITGDFDEAAARHLAHALTPAPELELVSIQQPAT